MIIVLQSAEIQIQHMINQFGSYKTHGEYGRSAFWIWHDKIRNEIKCISIKNAKKIGNSSYRFRMKYWGDILFDVIYIRNKGKFAGNNILITGFKFDEDNFFKWLQHEAPIEHKDPLPNAPDTRVKPKDIKFGFYKVKSKSGLWAIADSNGKLVSDDWFKDVSSMRKTAKGEISTIVNKDGWAFAFYPNRDEVHRLEAMNRSYASVIAESTLRRLINESIDDMCTKKMLSESFIDGDYITIDEDDIIDLVHSVIKKQRLNEKFYNPRRERMVDYILGEYEVLDGAEWKQILCDLPQKGWVEDIRMYSAIGSGGKTYCLYRRKDNGKYFFVEVVDGGVDEHLHVMAVKKSNIPPIIWNDAISLIRCS